MTILIMDDTIRLNGVSRSLGFAFLARDRPGKVGNRDDEKAWKNLSVSVFKQGQN